MDFPFFHHPVQSNGPFLSGKKSRRGGVATAVSRTLAPMDRVTFITMGSATGTDAMTSDKDISSTSVISTSSTLESRKILM